MKQTKKLIAILCVCLSALAVGCGSSAAGDATTESPAATDGATTDGATTDDAATTSDAATTEAPAESTATN